MIMGTQGTVTLDRVSPIGNGSELIESINVPIRSLGMSTIQTAYRVGFIPIEYPTPLSMGVEPYEEGLTVNERRQINAEANDDEDDEDDDLEDDEDDEGDDFDEDEEDEDLDDDWEEVGDEDDDDLDDDEED